MGHLVHHFLGLPDIVAADGESSPVAEFFRRARVRRPRNTNVTGNQILASKARSGPPNLSLDSEERDIILECFAGVPNAISYPHRAKLSLALVRPLVLSHLGQRSSGSIEAGEAGHALVYQLVPDGESLLFELPGGDYHQEGFGASGLEIGQSRDEVIQVLRIEVPYLGQEWQGQLRNERVDVFFGAQDVEYLDGIFYRGRMPGDVQRVEVAAADGVEEGGELLVGALAEQRG